MAASISDILERNEFRKNKFGSMFRTYEFGHTYKNQNWYEMTIEFDPESDWNFIKLFWSNEKDGDKVKAFNNESIFICFSEAFNWLKDNCHDTGLKDKFKKIIDEIEYEMRH